MNRYDTAFAALKKKNETAFIPFSVAGDPDLRTSEAIFKTFIDSGADILEIGYPFSDPVADGPVNQRAAIRAIRAGLNHAAFFSLIKKLRGYTGIPFGVLAYANSLHHIGYDTFCKRASDSGLDSILVADMPPEESDELRHAQNKHHLESVFIVSELTPEKRMKYICKQVTGFVYVVARLGSTGVQKNIDHGINATLSRLRTVTSKRLCVGFGLSRPEHIAAIRRAGADGAIVGSALVATIEAELKNKKVMLKNLSRMVKGFKKATKSYGF